MATHYSILTVMAWGILAMFLHELGHLVAAQLSGARIKRVGLRWTGPFVHVAVEPPNRQKALINLSAGITVNLLCALLFPHTAFGFASGVIGLFQLLPLAGSDGRQIWHTLFA